MRRALFWSLAAHVFVLWLMIREPHNEADATGSTLAVSIATKPDKPSHAIAAPLPQAKSTRLVGDEIATPQTPKQALTRNVDTPIPVALAVSVATVTFNSTSLDADGLRRYRFALAREMRRAWAYPPQALNQKLEGTTEIRIDLLAGGHFVTARIEKSSGYLVLDEAALKIITNAATAASVPSSLLGEAISIVQPVVFTVRGDSRSPEN